MKPNDPSDNLDDLDFTDEELLDQDLGDDLSGELEDYEEENWDDSSEAQAAAKPKKKSSLFTIVVIGAAVLIGGGILVSMGGKKSANDPGQAPPAEMAATAPAPTSAPNDPNNLVSLQNADAPADPTPPPAAAPSQGFMNNPTQLDQGGQAPSLPDTPSMTGFADTAPAPAVEPPPVADLPIPQQNLPNIDQIKKAAPPVNPAPEIVATPAPQPEPVASTPVAPIAAAPVTQTDPALQSKLDLLINRIDSLEKKISVAPAANNSNDIASLKASVERLENRVSQLSDNAVAPRPVYTPSYTDTNDSKVVVKKTAPKKKKAEPKKSSISAASSVSKWELRGARPGEAMVGKSGQADFRTVRVGDSIVGIGQIQSISQSGGRWVVQGTTGSITQ